MTYTPAEERRALNKLLEDCGGPICPKCNRTEPMDREPPYDADPETGSSGWRGGYVCPECFYTAEDEPLDVDAMVKYGRGA